LKRDLLILALCCTFLLSGDPPTPVFASRTGQCDPSRGLSPQMIRIPTLKDSWQIQRSCGFPDVRHVGFVVDLFYRRWNEQFGDKDKKVFKTLNGMMIEWGDEVKPIMGGAFDVRGDPQIGHAKGITLMPGYIWVWKEKYQRIAATALVHELVHSALWSLSGYHGDPDHEGLEFDGWTREHTIFIHKTNSLLAQLDI